jgi:hypothetical protein
MIDIHVCIIAKQTQCYQNHEVPLLSGFIMTGRDSEVRYLPRFSSNLFCTLDSTTIPTFVAQRKSPSNYGHLASSSHHNLRPFMLWAKTDIKIARRYTPLRAEVCRSSVFALTRGPCIANQGFVLTHEASS